MAPSQAVLTLLRALNTQSPSRSPTFTNEMSQDRWKGWWPLSGSAGSLPALLSSFLAAPSVSSLSPALPMGRRTELLQGSFQALFSLYNLSWVTSFAHLILTPHARAAHNPSSSAELSSQYPAASLTPPPGGPSTSVLTKLSSSASPPNLVLLRGLPLAKGTLTPRCQARTYKSTSKFLRAPLPVTRFWCSPTPSALSNLLPLPWARPPQLRLSLFLPLSSCPTLTHSAPQPE